MQTFYDWVVGSSTVWQVTDLSVERQALLEALRDRWLDPATLEVFQALDAAPDPTAFARVAAGFGDAELRALGLWAQLSQCFRQLQYEEPWRFWSFPQYREWSRPVFQTLARHKLAWQPQEAQLLWEIGLTYPTAVLTYAWDLPLAATERLDPGDRGQVAGHLATALQQVDTFEDKPIRVGLRRIWLKYRVTELLASTGRRTPQQQVTDVIGGRDALAAWLRADLAEELATAGIPALLRHCAGQVTARPSARWTRQARALVAAAPKATDVLRAVLTRLLEHREGRASYRRWPWPWGERTTWIYLDDETMVLVRGMVWSLESVQAGWVVPLLGAVAATTGTGEDGSGAYARCEQVANAAATVLGGRAETDAVAELARVRARVSNRRILACVDKALDTATVRAGTIA